MVKPFAGFVLLVSLAYGDLATVGVALSFLAVIPAGTMLFFSVIVSSIVGVVLMLGERKSIGDLSKRTYIVGARSDPRVWPRSQSNLLPKGEKLSSPSGMPSAERIDRAVPRWLTGATVGLAMLVAGVIMMVSAYLLRLG